MRKFSKALGIAALLGSAVVSNSVLAAAFTSKVVAPTDFTTLASWDTGACAAGAGDATVLASTDTFTICTGHTVTLGAAASIAGLTTEGNGSLVLGANNLALAAGTIVVSATGSIDASGGGDIATTGAVTNAGTITGGTGTIDSGAFDNSGGTLTGAGGAITTAAFTNDGTSVLTVGAGGMAVTDFTPAASTITLTGSMTISGNIAAGAATIGGAGGMILDDSAHTITGPVNVRNLSIEPLTAARTIAITGTVTEVGTTVLNGVAGFLIAINGGTITPAIVSNYCSAATTTNVTCNATPPVAASAPFASASLLWLFGGALGLFGLFGLNRTRKTAA